MPKEIREIKEIPKPVAGIDFNIPKDGKDGRDGRSARTPVRGEDYWTDYDKQEVISEAVKKIPLPKDGKDGISPDIEEIVKEVKKTPIHMKDIKGTEQLIAFLKSGGFRGGGGGNNTPPTPDRQLEEIDRFLQSDYTIANHFATTIVDYLDLNGHTLTLEGDAAVALIGSGTSGGGLPAAPNTSVQFNNSGSFGGDSTFTWQPSFGSGYDGLVAGLNVNIDQANAAMGYLGRGIFYSEVGDIGIWNTVGNGYFSASDAGDIGLFTGSGGASLFLDTIGNATYNGNTFIINGKLTVTGVIDPTALILGGSSDLYLESADGSGASVSPSGSGRIRYNQSLTQFEQSVDGNAYGPLGGTSVVAGTGIMVTGTGTVIDPYVISTLATVLADLLLVAGGAGGGSGLIGGAGGGAGGVIQDSSYPITLGSITVTVGTGGAGGSNSLGGNGTDSIFGTHTAIGGGGGAQGFTDSTPGGNGGSGGGGAALNSVFGPNGNPGTGTVTQGNNGGLAYGAPSYAGSGGGGGASTPGGDANGTNAGNGGNGITSSISGSAVDYGGGGGGGGFGAIAGTGGLGGGGAGNTTGGAGTNGTANTGGGGGAGSNTAGGNGGDGVAIIAYPTGTMTCIGGTITTSGGNTIHTFTTSGIFTRTA